LLARFSGDARAAVVGMLRFLSPVTAASTDAEAPV
jgi:hypothetical protein